MLAVADDQRIVGARGYDQGARSRQSNFAAMLVISRRDFTLSVERWYMLCVSSYVPSCCHGCGIAGRVAERELDSIARAIDEKLPELIEEIRVQNESLPDAARPAFAGELRMLNAIRHTIVAEMLARLAA